MIKIIGGGLAGCEAAWQVAELGIKVELYEMRGSSGDHNSTNAHVTDSLAELVCSNSMRSDDINNAVGLLHHELRLANSLIMESADKNRVPAGSALAVDRNGFAEFIQDKIYNHKNITVRREEVEALPRDCDVIVATGPLTSVALAQDIISVTREDHLAFFDAIAPIVYKESINFDTCWYQSRYDKGASDSDGDYINCPMNKDQYYHFIDAIIAAEKISFKEWEAQEYKYFNGCLPIEVMAERGRDTLLFGPMKPVGLKSPFTGERPFAVVQLRQDNKSGTLYNIVGFQTKLKYAEQKRIFAMIPGLESAEFARYGGLHRNTFINSPKVLTNQLKLRNLQNVRFAGQITGVEGYVESTAIGLLAGLFVAMDFREMAYASPPKTTAIGSLLHHITENAHESSFQPMNVNFGLFPVCDIKNKSDRKRVMIDTAISDYSSWRKSLCYQ